MWLIKDELADSVASGAARFSERVGTAAQRRERQLVERGLVHRLERLGYEVTLQPTVSSSLAVA